MSKIDPEINGLLERLATLGEMLEDGQRRLEALDRLPVGGARECLGTGLTKIGERPIPHFTAESVVSEPLDLLGETIMIEPLDRIRDPGMQGSPPVVEQAFVCHVVGESVLERILEIWIEPSLVEEFRGLQMSEPPLQRRRRQL